MLSSRYQLNLFVEAAASLADSTDLFWPVRQGKLRLFKEDNFVYKGVLTAYGTSIVEGIPSGDGNADCKHDEASITCLAIPARIVRYKVMLVGISYLAAKHQQFVRTGDKQWLGCTRHG